MADQIDGGLGNYSTARCLPGGMPRMMAAFEPQEYIIMPHTTYILIGENDHYHRIFSDGRSWPSEIGLTFAGYSIGKWIDEDGDDRYDVLEVETRGPFKSPRAYDAGGLPLHFHNQSTFGERLLFPQRGRLLMPTRKDQPRRTCDISKSRRNSDDSRILNVQARGGLIALGRHRTIPQRAHAR
jgi:hypothetical protein